VTSQRLSWECPRCGQYELTSSAESVIQGGAKTPPGAISGSMRRQNSQGLTPTISTDDLPRLRALVLPPFRERAELYLRTAVKNCPRLNDEFGALSDELIGTSYSADTHEALIIAQYLRDEGLIRELVPGGSWRVLPKGRIASDELAGRRAASSQAFVAMWFTEEMQDVFRDAIEPAIRDAGYAPMMIADKEHSNKIDDEIISEIRRSAFLIADFTGHRGGVYFEAGFALGLGLTVIWLCRKDALTDLHFDVRQYNCIDWSDGGDLKERLQKRITALFGQGPVSA
jgi:hypothetical protein